MKSLKQISFIIIFFLTIDLIVANSEYEDLFGNNENTTTADTSEWVDEVCNNLN